MFCVKGAEKQHSMCLVCVPLDVEDTLGCYQQALEKRPHCLQAFQHSRTLLLLHLAYTQPCESSSDYVVTQLHSYIVVFFLCFFTNSQSLHCLCFCPGFGAQSRHCQSRSQHSSSLVDFSHTVVPTPNIQPCDLAEEDFTSPDALYGFPISSDHMKTVTAAHSTSISKNTKHSESTQQDFCSTLNIKGQVLTSCPRVRRRVNVLHSIPAD